MRRDPWADAIYRWLNGRDALTLTDAPGPDGTSQRAREMRAASVLKRLGYSKQRGAVDGVRGYWWRRLVEATVTEPAQHLPRQTTPTDGASGAPVPHAVP